MARPEGDPSPVVNTIRSETTSRRPVESQYPGRVSATVGPPVTLCQDLDSDTRDSFLRTVGYNSDSSEQKQKVKSDVSNLGFAQSSIVSSSKTWDHVDFDRTQTAVHVVDFDGPREKSPVYESRLPRVASSPTRTVRQGEEYGPTDGVPG